MRVDFLHFHWEIQNLISESPGLPANLFTLPENELACKVAVLGGLPHEYRWEKIAA
jgi:hypothetical protein